jgi:F0F1-type ATP synthase assembly protein I
LRDEQEERGAGHEGGAVDRQTIPESDERETTRKSSVAYAAGLTIFFSVLSFMGLGWVLDSWLGTSWIMVTGIVLGAVVGFYEFIRIISKIK